MDLPLVTIGIPTYNRPTLLRRALECIATQDYPNLEVTVADNCSQGPENAAVVAAFRHRIKGIRYVCHATNIGAASNLLYMLDRANSPYIMWLADDDEISPNFVSSLVGLLEANPDAACAAGNWVKMHNESDRELMPTTQLPQKSAWVRAMKFAWWSDDAFFYGLHRTHILQRLRFCRFWWPNQEMVADVSYVFLMDVVLAGRVLLSPDSSVQFINHCYTEKNYVSIRGKNLFNALLKHFIRRINVHFLYAKRIAAVLGWHMVLPSLPVFAIVLAVEFALKLRSGFAYLGKRLFRPSGSPKT